MDLLEERSFLFKGRSTNEVVRIRGFTLGSFKDAGLPKDALPYVLEELENGKHPYLIAGAARALRGQKKPLVHAVPYLLKAIGNLSHGDDLMSFDSLHLSSFSSNYTTALGEIFKTLQWYGAYAKRYAGDLKELLDFPLVNLSGDNKALLSETISIIERDTRTVPEHCCDREGNDSALSMSTKFGRLSGTDIREIRMEDHTGVVHSYRDYFSDKPAIAVFFYTRCNNPNKCSLTITRLAQLQQLLREKGLDQQVRMAAFTYDPLYDVPFRLKNYCENRQLALNENCRSFRVTNGFEALQTYLGLGVNYIGAMVNKHKIELYLIDKNGAVRWASTRLQWDQEKVLDKLTALINNKKSIGRTVRNVFHNILSVFLFLGVAFFPKCPMCWAAYMSVLGITSLKAIAFTPWLIPLLVAGLGINLFVLWRSCTQRNEFIPFYLSVTGAFFISLSDPLLHWKSGSLIGLSLVLIGSLLNSLPLNLYNQLKFSIARFFTGIKIRVGHYFWESQKILRKSK